MTARQQHALAATARELVSPRRGILAADESNPTMSKRLLAVGAESTRESRGRFRELLITTPGVADRISGVFKELLDQRVARQSCSSRTWFWPAMTVRNRPWELTFSYGRAPQSTPLKIWAGDEGNPAAAQAAFAHRVRCTGEARAGRYRAALEQELAAA